jgi:hypothetical protein
VTRRSASALWCRCSNASGSSCTTRQQPGRQALGCPRLRCPHDLLVDGSEGVRLGHSARDAVDDAHLVGVEISGQKGFPYRRQTGRESTRASEKVPHVVRLLADEQRYLVRHEFGRLPAAAPSARRLYDLLVRGGAKIGEADTRGRQSSRSGRRFAPGGLDFVSRPFNSPELVHIFILTAGTDNNRTCQRFLGLRRRRPSPWSGLASRNLSSFPISV